MGLFIICQLLGYIEQKVKFNLFFLSLFFCCIVIFFIQEVMLDKIIGKMLIVVYVFLVVGGKVLCNCGGEMCVLCLGYVKLKYEVNYVQVVECLLGEDLVRFNDLVYCCLCILIDNLKQEEKVIVQVEEMQVVSVVLNGKYIMQGEQFDIVEVDFGCFVGNNIIQVIGKKWLEQDREIFDLIYDLDMYCDQVFGLINIVVMDGKVWCLLNGFKLFCEKLDICCGLNFQLEMVVKDFGVVVLFKGYYGDLVIVVVKIFYVVDNGIEKCYLFEGILVLGNMVVEGICCYGVIQDLQVFVEGIVVVICYFKYWLMVGDLVNEYIMMQFVLLMVLLDLDEFVIVIVG